jgi:cyclase
VKKRYFIYISYKGTAYHGWQCQPNGISVQEVLIKTLSAILRTDINLVGAGRTDAGVHAKCMVAHFDYEGEKIDTSKFLLHLNSFLPPDIAVYKIVEVRPTAHARFDAVSRRYEYHVIFHKDVFKRELVTRLFAELDFETMNKASALLCHYEDFGSFCKLHTDVKTIFATLILPDGNKWKMSGYLPFRPTVSCEIWYEPLWERFLRWEEEKCLLMSFVLSLKPETAAGQACRLRQKDCIWWIFNIPMKFLNCHKEFMLAKRIIPCLDVKDGKTVKGINFENIKNVGDAVELGDWYARMGADELVFLDITATNEKRKTLSELVTRIARKINIPFTVGGGISSVEDVSLLLSCGADKISINTAAVKNPQLISDLAQQFGSQCVVLAIDTKYIDGEWYVFLNGGRIPTDIKTLDWAKKAVALGAGEILLTSMNHDGTKNGFALDITRSVSESVNVPVIASGGAGKMEHFVDVFQKGKADAALAARIFHYREIEIPDLKQYLHENGVPVRL